MKYRKTSRPRVRAPRPFCSAPKPFTAEDLNSEERLVLSQKLWKFLCSTIHLFYTTLDVIRNGKEKEREREK
jgi:hypothetical protein